MSPPITFHPNWIKNAKVQIFKILNPQSFFKSAKAKLSKLEPFAWSHWIQKYLYYFSVNFVRGQKRPEMPHNFRKRHQERMEKLRSPVWVKKSDAY